MVIRHIHHHIKRAHRKNRKFFTNPFFWLILLLVSFFIGISLVSAFSADQKVSLKNSRISALVQNPYSESVSTEFPSGKDFIEVSVNAYDSSGTPLRNEPIVIQKSSYINVVGPDNTEDGNIQLKFSSTRSVKNTVRIKLKNYSKVKATFNIAFIADYKVKDLTDKNSFVSGVPLTFQAEIKPWMTDHIVSAKAQYIYTRRVNKYGIWRNEKRVVEQDLRCVDGLCQATFGSDNTEGSRNQSGNFTYKYVFKYENGKVFYSRAVKGKLKTY